MRPSGGGPSRPLGPPTPHVRPTPLPVIGQLFTVVTFRTTIHGEVELLLVTRARPEDIDQRPRLVWALVSALAAVDPDGRRHPLRWDLERWG